MDLVRDASGRRPADGQAWGTWLSGSRPAPSWHRWPRRTAAQLLPPQTSRQAATQRDSSSSFSRPLRRPLAQCPVILRPPQPLPFHVCAPCPSIRPQHPDPMTLYAQSSTGSGESETGTHVWFSPLGLANHETAEKATMMTRPMIKLQLHVEKSASAMCPYLRKCKKCAA